MNSVVVLEKVNFSYQEDLVLQDVSFTIDEGEFIGIIGPNGGGKTTLLKLLLGFLLPASGSLTIFGLPPQEVKTSLAYVPQHLYFDKQFPISVFELVLQGRLSHLPWYGVFSKKDREAAKEALNKVGLYSLKDRPLGGLSGGQIQRVLIARAIASSPRLLLLDEPTASVDAEAASEIYQMLQSLKGEMTIAMVTHHLQTAVQLVERVLCVQRTVTLLNPSQVCEHFALGLYHPPLLKRKAL